MPADGVPEYIRAGRCVEVWAPEYIPRPRDGGGMLPAIDADLWTLRRRWSDAVDRWCADQGIGQYDHRARYAAGVPRGHAPWSYALLRDADPDALAAKLDRLGLPGDWRPSAAPRGVRDEVG